MRPTEVVRRAAGYLDRHDVQSPRPTAELLLMHVLGTDRAGLYTRTEGLTSAEARAFGRALCRRCTGTPTQHLTGEQGFRRLVLAVRPGVFVPRPETELVVERALEAIRDVVAPVVVDIGTGTGAIALALKHERPDAQVMGTDRSVEALELARHNADRLGLDIVVVGGDLLDGVPLERRGRIDLVVSNPPYVRPEAMEALPNDVGADPFDALRGDADVTVRVLRAAAAWLAPRGSVVLEIGDDQGAEASAAATSAGFVQVRVTPDLAGRDRVLSRRRR